MTSIQGDGAAAATRHADPVAAAGRAAASEPGVLLAGWIQQVTDTLGAGDAPGTPGQALAAITALETLVSASAGAQARLTVAYDTLIRTQEQANGMTAARRGRTVASDIATARREPPHRGTRHLGLAQALLEMPNTAWALSTGQISEWKAQLLTKESAALTLEQRAGMDAELADIMLTVPDKVLESQARALAYAYDPASYLTRHRRAGNDRRVTIRPASDTMVYLSALLPMIPGISCYKALQDAADRALDSGNHPTTFGQPTPAARTDQPDATGSGETARETASEADEPEPRTPPTSRSTSSSPPTPSSTTPPTPSSRTPGPRTAASQPKSRRRRHPQPQPPDRTTRRASRTPPGSTCARPSPNASQRQPPP